MANKIKYGDRELDMGNLTLEQAKTLMARHFPELADPQVERKETKDGIVYTFTKKAGRKG
jgi:PRTRC genetic system protein C